MSADPRIPSGTAVPRLEIAGVSRSYGPIAALAEFSLSIGAGEVHALCGHNGAGKSTLVKVLSGLVRPDTGTLRVDGDEVELKTPQQAQRHGVALVDQEISLIDALSVADNILLGALDAPFFHRRGAAGAHVRELLARVGLGRLNPAQPAGSLSMGERQLVEIARALGRDARILILDEPTATLSEGEIAHVFRAVRSVAAGGASVIFVSHRLGEVLQLCDRVTVLREGRHVTTIPAAQLDRAQLIQLMLGERETSAVVEQVEPDVAAPAVHVRGLSVPARVFDVDLDVRPGQVVALAGQVGSGASELLRALAGLEAWASGDVRIGERPLRMGSPRRSMEAGVLFLSNDRKSEGLFLDQSVGRNLVATRLGALTRLGLLRPRDAGEVAGGLAQTVGLASRMPDPVSGLSGGNQQKIFLGRCLEHEVATLLLLDEPTRGVDVGGRAEIHALIRGAAAAGNAVVFASTEMDEVLDLADVVVSLYKGRVVSVRPRAKVSAPELVAEMTHAEHEAVTA